jgi:predicted PolB exonuclease-like 3'-5' exonuclease
MAVLCDPQWALELRAVEMWMFKSVQDKVWAFDAEWVPDPVTGRAVYRLPAELSDEEVVAEMWRRGGASEEEPRPYLKTVMCRVVSISVLARYVEGDGVRLQLRSLPAREDMATATETDIVARFLDGVGKQKPQLVGFNSESADLRILLQRALVAGVRAADFARRPEKPWEGVDYFAGGDWHVDLMTVIGGRGRGRPSLHEIAAASGIPAKFATEGGDVADLWLGGELEPIINYNEWDALTTYLVWLRLAHFGGFFSTAEYVQEQQLVEDLLNDAGLTPGREHLTRYLEEWRQVRGEAGGAGQMQLNL